MSRSLVSRMGFWSALGSTVFLGAFAVAFTVALFAFPQALEWHGIREYAASYNARLMFLLMFTPFLLAPSLLIMMACLHHGAPRDRRLLSLLALAFTCLYAAQITYNYYTQLTAVASSIQAGELEGLAIHAFFNPHSIPLSVEMVGYGWLSTAMVFAAFLFRRSAIFWLLLVNGILNVLCVFAPFAGIGGPPIVLALFNYSVPVATAMIAARFRRGVLDSSGQA